ncbi:cell surface protein [Natrarchaeobaculum sulfurireducens]|uniref:Beta-propeller repeat containing protein n=1 Tax=Natrarchaeobaculum sulfurireducens TaxID=2044521 RepID=A0A346PE39_9EURY|nr:cell surface protein [Natrarchaeobaculum sulfurireducens]AXR77784.1 Beta-propeller repeat containing protein [Natrarchaeobaculum sulfurireducens]
MELDPTRRTFLAGSATAGVIAVAGCTGGEEDPEPDPDEDEDHDDPDDHDDEHTDEEPDDEPDDDATAQYEIWALDQGRDNIHIYEPGDGDDEFDHVEEIDVNGFEDVPDEGVVPHMMDFSSDYEYAAIACTAGGGQGAGTLVFRTEDRELVGVIDTGPGSHMASFDPSDEYLHVDVMGDRKIVRVDADLEDETFEVVDYIEIHESDVVAEAGIDSGEPICHQYDGHGRTLHTLGPSYHDGALVIVDHDEFAVERAYSGDELPTNCGTMPHPTEDKFYLTAGLPSDPDAEEGTLEYEGVGDYYVYDTAEDEILVDGESTDGIDAHGFWFTPDGEELWVLNRETNDGVIVDPETDEVIEEIDAYGEHQSDDPDERDAPDIMWASPDGEYMFVTLRGPEPVSGDPHAATGVIPGFSVLDVESREIVDVIEPDPIADYDDEDLEDESIHTPDFHGIGVRPTAEFDSEIPNSPPF